MAEFASGFPVLLASIKMKKVIAKRVPALFLQRLSRLSRSKVTQDPEKTLREIEILCLPNAEIASELSGLVRQ